MRISLVLHQNQFRMETKIHLVLLFSLVGICLAYNSNRQPSSSSYGGTNAIQPSNGFGFQNSGKSNDHDFGRLGGNTNTHGNGLDSGRGHGNSLDSGREYGSNNHGLNSQSNFGRDSQRPHSHDHNHGQQWIINGLVWF